MLFLLDIVNAICDIAGMSIDWRLAAVPEMENDMKPYVPAEWRGRELTLDEVRQVAALPVTYKVTVCAEEVS